MQENNWTHIKRVTDEVTGESYYTDELGNKVSIEDISKINPTPAEIKSKTLEEVMEEPVKFESPKESDLKVLDQLMQDDTMNTDLEPSAKDIMFATEMMNDKEKVDKIIKIEDVEEMTNYIQGKGERPKFLDLLTTDLSGRLLETIEIMTTLQLSRIPLLLNYQRQIQEYIFAAKNLEQMDLKELTAASANIQKEINDCLNASLKSVQTADMINVKDNSIRTMLNKLLVLDEPVLQRIQEIIDDNIKN